MQISSSCLRASDVCADVCVSAEFLGWVVAMLSPGFCWEAQGFLYIEELQQGQEQQQVLYQQGHLHQEQQQQFRLSRQR